MKNKLNIEKLQTRVENYWKKQERSRVQSMSLNQLTIILLIYKNDDMTLDSLEKRLNKSYGSTRSLVQSLSSGYSKGANLGFIEIESLEKKKQGEPWQTMKLTKEGKKFARMIAPFFWRLKMLIGIVNGSLVLGLDESQIKALQEGRGFSFEPDKVGIDIPDIFIQSEETLRKFIECAMEKEVIH